MRRLLFLPLAFFFVASALAQQQRTVPAEFLTARSVEGPENKFRDATLELIASEAGRTALADYQTLKAAGKLPDISRATSYVIGERKMFSMRNLSVPDTEVKYDMIEYELRAEKPGVFNLWIQVSELDNGHVTQYDIDLMSASLGVSTSSNSYRPDLGIVDINTMVFGPAPIVDGDGVLDVLVGDIQDGYNHETGEGTIILGFFDPTDMTSRNKAEVIYLDSYPGIVNLAGDSYPFDPPAQTLAHEHQHLIFANETGVGDLSFVNEGLSEWAEVVNGFTPRPIFYFQVESERRHALLDFRDFGGPYGVDYQRAGLFTNYLAERIGVLNTGALARSPKIGVYGYHEAVSGEGLTLQELIADFHVANFLNDRNVADEFGYATPQRTAVGITNFPVINGTASSRTEPVNGTVNPGGAHYVVWDGVRNMNLDVSESNGFDELLAPVVIGVRELGPPEIIRFDLGGEPLFLSGNYERVVLILPHVYLWHPNDFNDTNPPSAAFTYSANWSSFETSLSTTIYDSGQAATLTVQQPGGPVQIDALYLPPNGQKANRFEVTPGSVLTKVHIDQPYEHDFSDSIVPLDAPRDFTLVIWDEGSDGNPGNELFTLDVVDKTVSGFNVFQFHTVDLSPYTAELSNLPPVIFIGSRNFGTDNNYLSMTVSAFLGDSSPSYWYDSELLNISNSPWGAFIDYCLFSCDDINLADYVLPIRATFAVGEAVAVESDGVLPERMELEQNYPNPFNPTTSIRFTVPYAGRVSLKIFDVLGREIRTLVDGTLVSGTHEIQFDASELASGVYVYALRTESEQQTRTMSVLK